MNQFQRSLPMMLYRALDALMPPFREIFTEHGLTEQQWRVLRVLWESDGRNLLGLSSDTLIPGPSLVGVIDRLVRDGLVVRQRSDIDRRVVHVFVTAKGKQIEKMVSSRIERVHRDIQASMSERAWRALFAALDEVTALNRPKP